MIGFSVRRGGSIAWQAVQRFVDNEALSHGAAIAFYAVTALAPILLIVLAIAGFFFGRDAAELALSAQLSGLVGAQGADLLKAAVESSARTGGSVLASVIGLATLIITASGVFGEMQTSLNKIWNVKAPPMSLTTLVRARAASLGLVAALGFLLLVSLVASAAITAVGDALGARIAGGEVLITLVNGIVSFALLALLFAAIYKVLPDRSLKWRDVIIGALVTTTLFTVGKAMIGWYLGASTLASSYGAAGGLFVLLLWVYYTSLVFLFGAELTRAYATQPDRRPINASARVHSSGRTEPPM